MSTSRIRRRSLLGLAVLAAATPSALVQAQDYSQVAGSIQRLYAALLAAMKAGPSTPFLQRYNSLAGPVAQALDLPYILQVAVGPSWSSMPASQQASLQQAFQRYTVATYTSQFDSFSGEKFVVLPGLRPGSSGDQVLHTQIIGAGGTPHTIDYVMRSSAGGWKAVDVLLDGSISRVAVLRSDFRRLVSKGGAAELTNYLQQKATSLAGTANLP